LLDVPVDEAKSVTRSISIWPKSAAQKTEQQAGLEIERARIVQLLTDTTLPEVDFRDASIRDVLRVLQESCNANTPGVDRIKFVLCPRYPEAEQPAVDEDTADDREYLLPISLRAENVSVIGVLDVIREYTGLRTRILPEGRVVVSPSWYDGEPCQALYWLNRSACAALTRLCCGTPPTTTSRTEISARFKEHMSALCESPDDLLSADLRLDSGVLIANATPAGLRRIEAFLRVISDGERAPDTYRMHAVLDADGGQAVLLFDAEEGHVWQYRAGHKDEEGNRCGERFALVPENCGDR
jgi:hypothetical protein